jgi:hypothetical protein
MNQPPRTDTVPRVLIDPHAVPRVLIGTHTYAGSPSAIRRQQEALDALVTLRGAEIVNVQFGREPHVVPEVRTLALLKQSSNSVSGRRGPSKAIIPEILDVLAAEASARSIAYICFTNSDIIFTQQAVDWIAESGKEAYLFSREDFDAETRAPIKVEIAGVDVLAVATAWWLANRRRFRRYIAGEACWDNVFTAIVMCHADALIENRRPLVRHERHPMGPMPSPYFGEYVRMLTALDAGYFTLWYRYWDGVGRLRAAGATTEEEAAWAREVFVWNPPIRARLVQQGRNVKALVRYAWWKVRAGPG